MRKERDPYHHVEQLGRDGLERVAELHTTTDTRERNLILRQRPAVAADRNHSIEQREALEQLPAVWETIYGDGDGYLALFSGLRAGKRLAHPQEGYFPYPTGLDQAQAWVRAAAAANRELYQCAHLLTAPRRRKAMAAPLWALYVDLDAGRLDRQTIPPPSLVVETSPGRAHCYWSLIEPVAPTVGEALNRQLAQATGADPSGWDLTQLLRVPGSRNHKYDAAPLVTVVGQLRRRYALAEITLMMTEPSRLDRPQPYPMGDARPVSGAAGPDLDHLPLTATARRILAGELPKRRPDGAIDRSASLMAMARVLLGVGMSAAAIVEVLAERDVALGWRKYSDRANAPQQYQRMVTFLQQQPRSYHQKHKTQRPFLTR